MCRAGGPRCAGATRRDTIRKRLARNRARAAELRAAGDTEGAAAAEQRVEHAAAELDDLAASEHYEDADPDVVQAEALHAHQVKIAGEQASADREVARYEQAERDRAVRAKSEAAQADRDRKAAAEVERRRAQLARDEERARKRRLAERAAENRALQAGVTEAQQKRGRRR